MLTLEVEEFVRRFLMHVLPARFHKIRHYGLLAARNRTTKLLTAQLELAPAPHCQAPQTGLVVTEPQTVWFCCPLCGSNDRVKIEVLPPKVFRANMLRQTDRAPPETSVLNSIY